VDIAGTLWLDPATSELRWLEYGYRNLDPDINSDETRERVEEILDEMGEKEDRILLTVEEGL